MVTTIETRHRTARSWNFGARQNPHSLDDFLARKAQNFKFFEGSEPWVGDHDRVTWENFFRFCTEEMDDLSQRAVKLVVEYCLEILEEAEGRIQGKPSLARLETALHLHYAEVYENTAYQYHWAMRHPLVSKAVNRALNNRFPPR